MDSAKRRMQKQQDYQRHKFFRKLAKRKKAAKDRESKAAEKELTRRLRVTPPEYGDGKSAQRFDPGTPPRYRQIRLPARMMDLTAKNDATMTTQKVDAQKKETVQRIAKSESAKVPERRKRKIMRLIKPKTKRLDHQRSGREPKMMKTRRNW